MSDMQTVNRILGLRENAPRTAFDMMNRIEQGFSLATLRRVGQAVAPADKTFIFQVVPQGTYKRRSLKRERLSPLESERMMRALKAYVAAERVFGDEALAREFMGKPHPMFDNQTPRAVALRNLAGLQAVLDVLGRGSNGSAA